MSHVSDIQITHVFRHLNRGIKKVFKRINDFVFMYFKVMILLKQNYQYIFIQLF